MLETEARWLGEAIGKLLQSDASPLVNLGSSTFEYRTRVQPFIQEEIFEPLERLGVEVIHVDSKKADGVDKCIDICSPDALHELQKLKARTVLCSNLLEHVEDREQVVQLLTDIVPYGGYLVISVPHSFPYHPDPIDTMYRPNVNTILELFPNFEEVEAAVIGAGNLRDMIRTNPKELRRRIVRCFVPFFRPRGWVSTMHHWLWLYRHYSVTCVVLKKVHRA